MSPWLSSLLAALQPIEFMELPSLRCMYMQNSGTQRCMKKTRKGKHVNENPVHINMWKRYGEDEQGQGSTSRGCYEFYVDIWVSGNAPLTSNYWLSIRRRFRGDCRSASEIPAVSNLRLHDRGDIDDPGSSFAVHSTSEGEGCIGEL